MSTGRGNQSVEELRRELAEARAQQAATAEILRVISTSPTDLQRAFAEIAASAARLCDAHNSVIGQVDGKAFRLVAHHGPIPIANLPLVRGVVAGRAVIERRPVHVADLQAETHEYPEGSERAQHLGIRTTLAVPLIRGGEAIGVISIRRTEVRPFTDRQIELLKMFADQAVIAIENTRLFEAEQARTKELTESLEYQTALADVLGIISRSPSNLQPVLDAIAASARRLCAASDAVIERLEAGRFYNAAHSGTQMKGLVGLPLPLTRQVPGGPAVLDRKAVIIDDIGLVAESEYPDTLDLLKLNTIHSVAEVPLLSEGRPLGSLAILRAEVRPFTNKEVAMLESFANQAVIAIENTRLFEELQQKNGALTEANKRLIEALEQQTATSEVLSVISRSPTDIQPVFDTIAKNAARLCEAKYCFVYRFDGELLHFVAHDGVTREGVEAARRAFPMPASHGSLAGRAVLRCDVAQIPDIDADPDYALGAIARAAGYRSNLAVPMVRNGLPIGAIALGRSQLGFVPVHQIDLLKTFADQAVIALENTRLFEEVQARTRELAKTVQDLEIASQHKSQFVANMSHELRTPLAAILGYAELMQEGFYGQQSDKSLDALTRIRSNGKHLLGLINTVLDIAKIESGQFTLNMAEYAIENVVETVRSATESLAQNKNLALKTEVAKSLPTGLGDEQRLTQVLLNLVGNAIKFTDTGEVCVTAKAVNGHFAVSVMDTGPGIAEQEQARIFEQFHQVDSSLTKAKGGTGLGLAIAKQIVEMHGGRIWVESILGKGSTFQLELPTRAEFQKRAP
jgi:signal transduction histidine kinase